MRKKKGKKHKIAFISIIAILSFIISVYMCYVSPKRGDIRRIESFLKSNLYPGRINETKFFPESQSKLADNNIEEFEKDIAKIESSKFFSLNSSTYYEIATLFFDYQNFEKSLDYVNKSLKKSPRFPNALLLRSVLNTFFGSFDNAKKDIDILFESNPNSNQIIKGNVLSSFLSYFSGDIKDTISLLEKSYAQTSRLEDYKEIYLFETFLLYKLYAEQGEYVISDSFYEKTKEIIGSIEKKKSIDIFTGWLIGIILSDENINNYQSYLREYLSKQNNNIFWQILSFFTKALISQNNFEEYSRYLEQGKLLSDKHNLLIFSAFFDQALFEAWLIDKGIFNKELFKEIKNSTLKIPFLEADLYKSIGLYYRELKQYDTAIDSLDIAFRLYSLLNSKENMIKVKIILGITSYEIKNYYNANKFNTEALNEIENILEKNRKASYSSKKIAESITELSDYKKTLATLVEIGEKILK
jgi:tetratricopeptide (TPR) repeat protein